MSDKELEWDYSDLQQLPENIDVDLEKKEHLDEWINYSQKNVKYWTQLKNEHINKGEIYALEFRKLHYRQLPRTPEPVTFFLLEKKSEKTQSKKLENLCGKELLQELETYIRDECMTSGKALQFDPEEKNIENIQRIISEGEYYIAYKHKQILCDAVQLGMWLERLREINKKIFQTFVDDNCTFTIQWANQVRNFSVVFSRYSKLQKLNISLTMGIKLHRKINAAFSLYPEEESRWKK